MSIKIPVQSCRKIRHRQNANPATRVKRFANSAKFIHSKFSFGAADFKLKQLSCGRFFIMVVNLGSIPWMAANRLASNWLMVFHLLQRCQTPCERLLIMALREGFHSIRGCQSPCGRFWPPAWPRQLQHQLSLHQCYRRNSSSKPTFLAHFRWPTPTKTTKFFGTPQSSADSSP